MRFRRLSEVNFRFLPRGSFRYRAGACKQSIAYWVRPMQMHAVDHVLELARGRQLCESPTVCFDNPATGSAARTCVCVCVHVCVCMYV